MFKFLNRETRRASVDLQGDSSRKSVDTPAAASTAKAEQPKEAPKRVSVVPAKWTFRQAAEKVVQQLQTTERDSQPHKVLRDALGNSHGAGNNRLQTRAIHAFEAPSNTGVIYCTDRATTKGWKHGDPAWSNFGQGAPETGKIPGGVEKPMTITTNLDEFEYAPVAGVKQLREAIANLYNVEYRQRLPSKYTWENVCVVPGGRAGLTRIAAAIGDANVGFFLPEYTAYEQLLSIFKRFVPIPTPLDATVSYHVTPEFLEREISARGLGVVLKSNPANPTGQLVQGEELGEWIEIAKRHHTTLIMDEFYSRYIYPSDPSQSGAAVSAAAYVTDVNEDPVVLIDGLTKSWRLPGWRVCWIVGPKELISAMTSAGSFLDGGTNHPLQVAAVPLLEPERVKQDTTALQKHFKEKRDYVLGRLDELGLHVACPPTATFYIWLDLTVLPEPINNGLTFFEELLEERVIVVPGIFFDINPGHRRELFASPYHHHVRLSFGPPMEELIRGMEGIERLLKRFKYEKKEPVKVDLVEPAAIELNAAEVKEVVKEAVKEVIEAKEQEKEQ
ncbi:hypothetical protein HDV00_007413 [Rhizophlyctis rosea]|nr:hypothetical protein HDV00_007413 [Rhizophlyctis rosea]